MLVVSLEAMDEFKAAKLVYPISWYYNCLFSEA